MAKITSFMRVTKQPKAHGKKVDSSPVAKKQHVTKKEEVSPLNASDEESSAHIPTFIYKTVKYKHKHKKHEVSKEMKTIVEYIKYYDVPKDLETNVKFGCHSGLTYEKRLARAYSMDQLSLKHGKKNGAAPKPICLTCASVGHTHKTCPDGF
ncbi:hypothetical protein, variant 1 [Phytophthora nicotianae CJ01A1]|uniref:Uncharacterized protein n=5 Tax=Phytophthora nicotianae TaxID=4792 RepID=V9ENK5_PHYNI|nr:hypothetical protein, variant 1 [Phytophthora nicotianae P1569]ETK80918.1 hypothetical protein, variant 1 [Phytophthora nicotianae]ETO69512.1 hypothetical protein, variant 1 [Phytophthora nicotianae P1976]ETP10552.1 hypothetical protein, variant 1 [Phytophthora nicotianae CJ01A1]ETP38752.1 hypothetical protein, variant 1 [Phytophthora nicotianae P10297]